MKLQECIRQGNPTVHFSIDDCIWSLRELYTKQPNLLFDIDYFDFLRSLHNETGVIFTCYFFFDNSGTFENTDDFSLQDTSDRYQAEFQEASSWLRWVPHGKNQQTPMTCQTTDEVLSMVMKMKSLIARFSGQTTFPTCWRAHFHAADRDACTIMQNECGIEVLFTSDDNRKIVACLKPEVVEKMQNGGPYKDPTSGFILVKSLFRCESPDFPLARQRRIIAEQIKMYSTAAFFIHEHELLHVNGVTDAFGISNVTKRRSDLTELLSYAGQLGEFSE